MNVFFLMLKGFIVGIGKIIPGVSGSMLAITLGVYEDLIGAVTNFFGDVKKNIRLLFPFCIGLFLAIVFFSKVIIFLLDSFYFETIYLFLGLIVGTMLPFVKKVTFHKKNKILFLLSLFLVLFMGQISSATLFSFEGGVLDYLYTILLGGIDALCSIVPGISGTAIYLLMGVYQYVLSVLANPFSWSFVFYAIGMVVGAIFTCYLMYYLFKYYKEETYSVLFAFMVGSMYILLCSVISSFSLFLFFFFLGGLLLGFLLDR